MQRALMQYKNPQNQPLVRKALRIAGREDLIGYGKQCLVPPERDMRDDRYPTRPGRQSGARAQGDSPPRQAAAKQRKAAEPPAAAEDTNRIKTALGCSQIRLSEGGFFNYCNSRCVILSTSSSVRSVTEPNGALSSTSTARR